MNEHLRPSTLGEILDRTVSLYRARFLIYLGIAALPAAVILGSVGSFALLVAWSGMKSPDATFAVGLAGFALVLIAFPLAMGANALSDAALCHAASTQLMDENFTVAQAYKAIWKRGWSYVGLYVLQVLIIAVAPFVLWSMMLGMMAVGTLAAGGAAAGGTLLNGLFPLFMFLGLLGYAVWMLLQLCLAFPASVVERVSAGEALRRTWILSKGTKGRMFVLFLLGLVLTWLLTGLLVLLVSLALNYIPALSSIKHTQAAVTVTVIGMYAAGFLVQAMIKPVYGIALVLFYYDQRVRQEAFDVEMLMQRAGMVQEPAAVIEESAPWMPTVIAPVGEERETESAAATSQTGETGGEI